MNKIYRSIQTFLLLCIAIGAAAPAVYIDFEFTVNLFATLKVFSSTPVCIQHRAMAYGYVPIHIDKYPRTHM